MADWEGGVRANAFVSGGYLPAQMRGTTLDAYIHIADWYATFCAIAGVSPVDTEAAAVGLPPVDGVNVWPVISGETQTGPRDVIHLSTQAVISQRYKLVTGVQAMNGWTGPTYPNTTGPQPTFVPLGWDFDCGAGCLFDIMLDPNEHVDLASSQPAVLASMQQLLASLNATYFNPNRGNPDPAACQQAVKYGGFYGPFAHL
jgi:arylsulfatase A-like enzyme